ncbi:IclR family transcriptional regulator [Herbaspirillum sp. NPDC087042]|uniref:IclR family transcriptional regulator n=1 Tax=Herbaspirillum sp. NPDC087042 TaxID=3364004 RepID=UPI0038191283
MNDYTVASVDSALQLLAIITDRPGLNLSELADCADMNTSRAFRLLTTLAGHRLVERVGDPAVYRLGTQALVMGLAAGRQIDLAAAAQAPLLKLVEMFNEACQVRVRDGFETVCIARVESTHAVRVHGVIGNRRPVHVGASGKLLMAYAPEAERERLLKRPLKQFTGRTRSDAAALHEELAAIVENGYALSQGEATPGAVAIAVPVMDARGNVLAALGMSIVESRYHKKALPELVREMSEAARELSRQLGHKIS